MLSRFVCFRFMRQTFESDLDLWVFVHSCHLYSTLKTGVEISRGHGGSFIHTQLTHLIRSVSCCHTQAQLTEKHSDTSWKKGSTSLAVDLHCVTLVDAGCFWTVYCLFFTVHDIPSAMCLQATRVLVVVYIRVAAHMLGTYTGTGVIRAWYPILCVGMIHPPLSVIPGPSPFHFHVDPLVPYSLL